MKKLLFALALMATAWGGLQLAADSRSTVLADRPWIPWEVARQQNDRPILLVQMFGDLDEDWC